MKLQITVIMVTKNEEVNIVHSLPPLIKHFDEVIVVDSESSDNTAKLAEEMGATVHKFVWNGKYPKKRQWCIDNIKTKYHSILMLDADEIITDAFAAELASLNWVADGYFVKSDMVWNGNHLKYGMKNNKLCLFKKSAFAYPVVDDLKFEGMGEIEGHYQPVSTKKDERIGQINSPVIHHDRKGNWHDRHESYKTWEIAMNRFNAWPIDPIFYREIIKDFVRINPFRGHIMFFYGYILKGGFLDGKQGLDYALNRFRYNQSIVREAPRTNG